MYWARVIPASSRIPVRLGLDSISPNQEIGNLTEGCCFGSAAPSGNNAWRLPNGFWRAVQFSVVLDFRSSPPRCGHCRRDPTQYPYLLPISPPAPGLGKTRSDRPLLLLDQNSQTDRTLRDLPLPRLAFGIIPAPKLPLTDSKLN